MFSRIHEKLGTAGFIIAIVALIAALSGTALAAMGLNGKQKKEVTKIAKKYAGHDGKDGAPGAPGATGQQGPKGDKGDSGATGDVGPAGAQGEPGQNGQPGEDGFCSEGEPECVLPAGSTLTGSWAANSSGTTELDSAYFAISYPLRVVTKPEVRVVSPGEAPTTDCPGSLAAPDAEPGFLCIYQEGNFNAVGPAGWVGLTEDYSSGLIAKLEPATVGQPVFSWGNWAVTAAE
jgi:Collagen triple helix repeat (20 copies)